jgi:fumarylacetoacetase
VTPPAAPEPAVPEPAAGPGGGGAAACWVEVEPGSDFPVTNLPLGVFTDGAGSARVGVAIGGYVLDAARLATPYADVLDRPALNAFLALGPAAWADLRGRLTDLLTDREQRCAVSPWLRPVEDVELLLPFEVADYVDFYASEAHASNVSRIFRPGQPPLQPNWKRLPVGYHGRAGTVVVSGTPVIRPSGQRGPDDYGPTAKLDIEAEVGFVVGMPSPLGAQVPADAFAAHVFGVVLLNDWSARDIQRFETVPLGPFLGKSFATSISPWVVPLAALEAARVPGPVQDPEPAPYLRTSQPWGLDLTLTVECNGAVLTRPPARELYWTAAQQLAHLTVNGAALRTGDLYASGTVSGERPDQVGSLLELTWDGTRPVALDSGGSRTWLEDDDTVTIRASAPGVGGTRIGFGAVTGTIRSAAR